MSDVIIVALINTVCTLLVLWLTLRNNNKLTKVEQQTDGMHTAMMTQAKVIADADKVKAERKAAEIGHAEGMIDQKAITDNMPLQPWTGPIPSTHGHSRRVTDAPSAPPPRSAPQQQPPQHRPNPNFEVTQPPPPPRKPDFEATQPFKGK